MSAPVVHFLPLTLIRRERVLPQVGKVIVRAGQKLNAMDVIAETVINAEYQLLDISQILRLSTAKAENCIQCKIGDHLAPGDVVAGPVGFSKKVVRAKKDSKVVLAGDGKLLLEMIEKPFQLKASFPGDVVGLIPDRGAVIETTGSLIQGVWGNDRLEYGTMVVLAKQPDHILTVADLDITLRGAIVFSGHCADLETLKMAEDLPLRGLILGSMEAELLPYASQMRFPIILIEGFGKLPLNPIAFRLLASNDRREIALNAAHNDQISGQRPEIVIPLPAPANTTVPQEIDEFSENKQVRITRAPFSGQVGLFLRLRGNTIFDGGLRAPAAEIRLSEGQNVLVPLANLEIIQ